MSITSAEMIPQNTGFSKPQLFSVISIGAEGTQKRFARPVTTHEKIEQLLEYLKESKSLVSVVTDEDDWYDWLGSLDGPRRFKPTKFTRGCNIVREFHLITCEATRVFIPPKSECLPEFEGLYLWVSASGKCEFGQNADVPGFLLLLIEDSYADDGDRARALGRVSGYTELVWLIMAMMQVGERLKKTVMDDWFIKLGVERVGEVDHYSMDDYAYRKRAREYGNPNLHEGGYDVFNFLSSLGGKIGPKRTIRSLYRVREISGGGLVYVKIFGYPIFVSAESGAPGTAILQDNT